jgi:hypothetical protein
MNIECRRKVFVYFAKKRLSQTKRPFEILRFDILLFCGSLFRPGEVSYKNTVASRQNKEERAGKGINHDEWTVG